MRRIKPALLMFGGTLKPYLPRSLFKSQAKFFMISSVISNLRKLKSNQSSCFRTSRLKQWMQEYNVNPRKPNKRFKIKEEDRKEGIYDYPWVPNRRGVE